MGWWSEPVGSKRSRKPKPGGYDNAGNRRPREKSPEKQERCGHWVARVSGGTAWCERCGADCGPAER